MQLPWIVLILALDGSNVSAFSMNKIPLSTARFLATSAKPKDSSNQSHVPIHRKLSTKTITNENLAGRLESYRFQNRRPLVDVRQIKDEALRNFLQGSEWGVMFDLPSTLPQVGNIFTSIVLQKSTQALAKTGYSNFFWGSYASLHRSCSDCSRWLQIAASVSCRLDRSWRVVFSSLCIGCVHVCWCCCILDGSRVGTSRQTLAFES